MNDAAHQLTSDAATRPSDAARYRYDAAGNPVDRAELGLGVTNSFNNLNQIVTGSWTGAALTVAGSVNYPAGSISVNGQPGTVYSDSSFDVAAVPVAPGTNTLTATYTGPAFTNVPMTATDTSTVVLGDTAYTHDANGNLTSDATFTYQYDLANQLTNVIRKSDSVSVLQCRYDALGRRVEAIRADGTVDRYIYFPGSFLVLAVLDGNNTPKEYYTRGPDLSGTLDSAGGISGILACIYSNAPTAPLYHHADLMGNVISLTDASGSVLSTFRYTPFGKLSSLSGMTLPRYLFSSKEWEATTKLVYYGYRYYSPQQAQWLSKDSVMSFSSPYGICAGNTLRYIDAWGMYQMDVHYTLIYRAVMETHADSEKASDVAEELAYYSQYPDAYFGLDAICQSFEAISHWGNGYRIQRLFHQLNGYSMDFERDCVRCCLRKVFSESTAMWEKGFALHALGDSYAHSELVPTNYITIWRTKLTPLGFDYQEPEQVATDWGVGSHMYSTGFGHLVNGTVPDKVAARQELAIEYCRDLLAVLSPGNDVDPVPLLKDLEQYSLSIPRFQKGNYPLISDEQIQQWMQRLEDCISGQ